MRLIALFLMVYFLIVSCETNKENTTTAVESLEQLFENYKDFQFYTYPEYASYEGYHQYNNRLTDQSIEAGKIYIDSIKKFKSTLESINTEKLSENDKLNYQLFLFALNETIDRDAYEIDQYLALSQQNGFHIYFPQIIGYQPFNNKKDVNNYFERLQQFSNEIPSIIKNLEIGLDKGIVSSCNITEQVLEQLKTFSTMEIKDYPLYTIHEGNEILSEQKDSLASIIAKYVKPSYEKLYTFYKDNYHPSCREAVGISNVTGGKDYYKYLTQYYTTSNLTPEEVFKIGKQEVDRIKNEILKVKDALGYEDSDLSGFYTDLRTNPKYYFTEKEDLMNGFRSILEEMDKKLPELFGKLPETPYDLKEIESYRAKSAPAAYYYSAPDDGSRPGYFYVNTYDLSSRPKYTMTALALHEAVPGHHLQIALAKELENVPWFRKQLGITAFVEGWGLYAEYLGYETDMYTDTLQYLGALTFEMWRACRLVVDVGIHYKNWSREEAIEFMQSNLPLSDLDVQSEVDRYIAWPGQALAYKIGELKLKALREKANKALGKNFDVKTFHDKVLENGSIPLFMLEENIDKWIESKQ